MSKHKDLRQEHHKDTHKYEKQKVRTAANKAARLKRLAALRETHHVDQHTN